MEKIKLIAARNAKGYSQEYVASQLCMDASGYIIIDCGLAISPISSINTAILVLTDKESIDKILEVLNKNIENFS